MSDRAEHGDQQSRKSLELLKISIKARIEDFDNFFKRNFTDYRIPLFEKQKYRLRKLIHDSEHVNRVARELDIKFSIDDTSNTNKHNAMRQERSKTPVKVKSIKNLNKPVPARNVNSKSPLKAPNTLVKVKMTKEEYEEYVRQLEGKQINKQPASFKNLPSHPQPVNTKMKPPISSLGKSPINNKRV